MSSSSSKKTLGHHDEDHVNVFGSGYMGGPLGFGDPDDKSLRHVEEHVYITQIIKDRAHHEKCHDLIKKWGECMEENNYGLKGFFSFVTCKKPLDEMNKCLGHYYKDKEFREECKNMYIERRTKYRSTGVVEPNPYYKKPYYESEKKREYLEQFRKEKEQQQQQQQQTGQSSST